jgi:hypothetical protein
MTSTAAQERAMKTPPSSSLGRVVGTVAGITALVAALAGCASKTASTSPGTPAGGGATSATTAPTSAPTSASTTPAPTIKYVSPVDVAVSSDGKTLSTPVDWSGCAVKPEIVVVSQDGAKVVIEMKDATYARMGVMCPNIARTGTATLMLDAPLGNRQLVDGITNAPIAKS